MDIVFFFGAREGVGGTQAASCLGFRCPVCAQSGVRSQEANAGDLLRRKPHKYAALSPCPSGLSTLFCFFLPETVTMNMSCEKRAASGPAAPCMPSQGSEARKRTLLTFYEGERTILILNRHVCQVCQARSVFLTLNRLHARPRQGGQPK